MRPAAPGGTCTRCQVSCRANLRVGLCVGRSVADPPLVRARNFRGRSQSVPAKSQAASPAAGDARTRLLGDAGFFSALAADLASKEVPASAGVDGHANEQDWAPGSDKRVVVKILAAEYLPQLAEGPCTVVARLVLLKTPLHPRDCFADSRCCFPASSMATTRN